jgi:WhiB family redox-sensing transcriptional regulator
VEVAVTYKILDPSVFLAVPVTEERPWMVFSACRDADPDLFFPTTTEEMDHALALCAICPVRCDCLEYALDARERFGIWGGLTEKQRLSMARRTA